MQANTKEPQDPQDSDLEHYFEDLSSQYLEKAAEYVTSQRGDKQLKLSRYLHPLHSTSKKEKIFKCVDDCKCRVHVDLTEDINIICHIGNRHNHSDDRLEVGKHVFRKALKDKAEQQTQKSIAQLNTETTTEVYQDLDPAVVTCEAPSNRQPLSTCNLSAE